MTVRDWIIQARSRLSAFDAPVLEAEILAAHTLGVNRSWLFAHPEADFPELAGESLVQRRQGHEPLAYILGHREFYGRRFSVDPRVLIPRQETEILVEAALNPKNAKRVVAGDRTGAMSVSEFNSPLPSGGEGLGVRVHVLDLGTGSGCIGITLKLERPEWDLTLSDISAQALEVAHQNAIDLHADVHLIESDGFTKLTDQVFDLIVTNPPYIGTTEQLSDEVLKEPNQALFAGTDGLDFYRRLASEAAAFLTPGGYLMMEIGYRQAEAVQSIFAANGWNWLETIKDLDGNDRVVIVDRQS